MLMAQKGKAAGGDDPNLVIEDAYIQTVGARAKQYGAALDSAMNRYITILGKVAGDGLASGDQHDALEDFISTAKSLYAKGKLKTISETLGSDCDNFVAQIDRDDQFLY